MSTPDISALLEQINNGGTVPRTLTPTPALDLDGLTVLADTHGIVAGFEDSPYVNTVIFHRKGHWEGDRWGAWGVRDVVHLRTKIRDRIKRDPVDPVTCSVTFGDGRTDNITATDFLAVIDAMTPAWVDGLDLDLAFDGLDMTEQIELAGLVDRYRKSPRDTRFSGWTTEPDT